MKETNLRFHREDAPSSQKKNPNAPVYVTQHPASVRVSSHIVYRLHCNRRHFLYEKSVLCTLQPIVFFFSKKKKKEEKNVTVASHIWSRSVIFRKFSVDECHSTKFIENICSKLRVVKLFNIRVRFHARRIVFHCKGERKNVALSTDSPFMPFTSTRHVPSPRGFPGYLDPWKV